MTSPKVRRGVTNAPPMRRTKFRGEKNIICIEPEKESKLQTYPSNVDVDVDDRERLKRERGLMPRSGLDQPLGGLT